MATAVLLPQDCLPGYKSRQKSKFSGTWCHTQGAPRGKRGISRASAGKNTPFLYPGPSKGLERTEWNVKTSKLDMGDFGPCPGQPIIVGDEAMGFKCQASKGNAGFKKEVFNAKVELLGVQETDFNVPDLLGSDSEVGGYLSMKDLEIRRNQRAGVPKLMNFVWRNGQKVAGGTLQSEIASQKLGLRSMMEQGSFYPEDMYGQRIFKQPYTNQSTRNDSILPGGGLNQSTRNDSTLPGGGARLRRASTDPQLNYLVCQQRSDAIRIPYYSNSSKSVDTSVQNISMSCPERWAGPAYSSSPPPSSLPLPKFSLPVQRTASAELSPFLSERHGNSRVYQLQDLMSTSALEVPAQQGPALDVALATMSLRRMLKLDPY